jgi:uncharacterized membrane protein YfcA
VTTLFDGAWLAGLFGSGFVLHEIPFFQMGVIFFGYFVLGVTGFGSALIIIPLLAWQWPLSLIVPLVLLMDVPTSMLHTGMNVKRVAWRELPPLLPTVLAGALVGIVLVQRMNGTWLLAALGLYIGWVGIRGLRGARVPIRQPHRLAQMVAGFLMGLVETSFGAAGPVVVAWLGLRLHDPHELRATLPTAIVALATIALIGFAVTGKLSHGEVWGWLLLLVPFAALGVWSGHQVAVRINSATLKPVIYGLLTLSGLTLVVKAFFT